MPRRFPFLAVLTVLAAGAHAVAPAAAHAQLSVPQLVAQLTPADSVSAIVIPVRNEGPVAVDVDVVINDWQVEPDGSHRFIAAGTLPDGCGARLASAPATFRAAAGATVDVRVTHDGTAADRCRGIVFFRVTERPRERLIISTGVKVYVRP